MFRNGMPLGTSTLIMACVATVAVASGAALQTVPERQRTTERRTVDVAGADTLAARVARYMTAAEADGFSGGVLVATSGAVVLADGYGFADRSSGKRFSPQTVFPVGSVTKQFTGAAVLKAEMLGLLDTGDHISKYFGGVPADKSAITIHHLLTHSAGFVDALGFDFAEIGRDEYVRTALASELQFAPGTSYSYSNVGYSLLAAIIELTTGSTYQAFARRHLFEPAGLQATGYDLAGYGLENLAHGYNGDEDWGTMADKPWSDDGPFWHLRGNGGIHSTLHDLFRWQTAIEGTTVLSESALRKYLAPHVQEGDGAAGYYGYGWVVEETPHGKLVWHDGGNPYYSTEVRWYVDAGVFLVVTANTRDRRAFGVMEDLAAIAFGDGRMSGSSAPADNADRLGETPAGQRAAAFVEMVGGEPSDVDAFMDRHIAARLLESVGRDRLRSGLRGDQERLGALSVTGVRNDGPNRVVVNVRTADDRSLLLTVDVEPGGDRRIVGIGLDGE